MSITGNGGETEGSAGSRQPQLNVLAQYVKDFSFENPNAPRSLGAFQQRSRRSTSRSMSLANALNPTDFEVDLKTEGKAEREGKVLFGFDLVFGGVFRIQNVPQESMHPVVMIECPRLLFPFAREIVAAAVRNGGFPPLLLDPVDFVGLYRQKLAQQALSGTAPPA